MLRFALKNLWIKKGKFILSALSVTLSAGVALMAYNISMQVKEGIVNTAAYYDIIIGPSGSSTQLAMNTMFFTDSPLGTIPYAYVEELKKNPDVNQAVPFTMGDSYNAARVVGTTADFLSGKALREGDMFSEPFEAVVGSAVARQYGLSLGDTLITSHGLSSRGTEHAASPLTVTGILSPSHTAYDNAVFTSVETVWAVHDHHHEDEEEEDEDHAEGGEVCAILVRTKSFNAYYTVSNYYSQNASLLVINPATVLREVLKNVDTSSQIVYLLCGVILVMNLLVIWVITLMNLYDARKEISLMRLIGVSMKKISLLYLIQNGLSALLSVFLALGLSRAGMALSSRLVADMGIVLNPAVFYPLEAAILIAVWVISALPILLSVSRMARKDTLGGE